MFRTLAWLLIRSMCATSGRLDANIFFRAVAVVLWWKGTTGDRIVRHFSVTLPACLYWLAADCH
jgi:hypothetical protein